MAVLLKCGAVFLHVPKTGGSWVTHVLKEQDLVERPIGHVHADCFRLAAYFNRGSTVSKYLLDLVKSQVPIPAKKGIAKLLNKRAFCSKLAAEKLPFSFCFVRHPLSWYESWWKYMSGRGWHDWGSAEHDLHWHPNAILNGLGHDDFNVFVRNVIQKRAGYVSEMFGWYTQPGIGFVGKQETLADDLISVLRHLNVRFDEQRIRNYHLRNVSHKPKRTMVWDEQLKAEVQRLEYAALVRYNYSPAECRPQTSAA